MLGPDGHSEKFDFYLQSYVKLLRGYKETPFIFILKTNSSYLMEIGLQGFQVESRRPVRGE